MREIKFRAKIKNPHADKWVYGYLVSETYINEKNNLGYTPVRKETVGQYTGLHDKNGKEIYEGDIVYVVSEDENAFILWDEETARYIIQFNGWCADFDNYYDKELEVIGNIYDNPDLLEKASD